MQRVAEAAGVSKSSVSLALRDDPRLAPETRRRVQEVAARMGYRRNPIIASLMAQLRISHTPKFHANLGLLNCSADRALFESPTFSEVRRGIREGADRAGYGVEEFWAEDPAVKLARLRQILRARNIRGLVLAAPPDPRPLFPGHHDFINEFAFAVVGVNPTEPSLPRASNNHFQTARAAVDLLSRRGYRRAGLVLLDDLDRALGRRLSGGFLAGVRDGPAPGGAAMALLLGQPDRAAFVDWLRTARPDAILTDLGEVLDWVRDENITIPEELGLIHLNWRPPLGDWAGMRQNSHLVGVAAAELVVAQITHNETGPPRHPNLVLVESDFVPGPSLRDPPRAIGSRHPAARDFGRGSPAFVSRSASWC